MKKILKKIILGGLVVVVVVFSIGTVYEQLAQVYFDGKRPGKNSFVQIKGIPIHFNKKGNGGPTVVFQSGLGGDYKIWEEIQDSLANYTTTLSYDRAGLLWSGPSNETRTLESITEELEELLGKTGCSKPYILIGHSLAGLTLRPFVLGHKEEVKSVVFVDVAHPLQVKKSSEELKKYLVVPPQWLLTFLVETGIVRTYFSFKPFIAELPTDHWMNQHIKDYFYRFYKTMLQEAKDDDLMFEQSEQITSFGEIPLTVITGAYPNGAGFLNNPAVEKEYLDLHSNNQLDLLKLSTNSKQLIAKNSGHYVPLQDPELVIEAIKVYLK